MKKLVLLTVAFVAFGCMRASAQTRPVVGPIIIAEPANSTTSVPLTINASNNQTSNAVEVRDGSSVLRAYIKPDGTVSGKLAPNNSVQKALLFTDLNGVITSTSGLFYDSVGSRFGIGTNVPDAEFHVNVSSLFTDRVQFKNQGYATTSFGDDPNVDASVWSKSFARESFNSLQSATNEWGHAIQMTAYPSPGTNNYEKAALIVMAATADPSPSSNKDIVGADIRAIIASSISTGRAFGVNPWCQIQTGGNGLCVGTEIDLSNGGTNQTEVDTTTTKTGLQIVNLAASAQPSTVAAAIVGGGVGKEWNKGFWARQSSLVYSFIELDKTAALTEMFRVKPTGQTLIGDMSGNATNTDYLASTYGQLSVKGYATVVDSTGTTDHHTLYLFADSGTSKNRIGTAIHPGSGATIWPLALETQNASLLSNEVLLLTNDPFVQFTKGYVGATVSAAGTAALRNNVGVLEFSNNAGPWAAVSSVVASGWTDAGANVYNTTQTDRVMIGLGAGMGDFSAAIYNGSLEVNQQAYVTDGTVTNTSVVGAAWIPASNFFRFGVGRTGVGTYRDLVFTMNGSDIGKLFTTGNWTFGGTIDNGYKVEVTGTMNVSSTLTASLFSGSGASLTALNATNVSSGTLNSARLPATIANSAIDLVTSGLVFKPRFMNNTTANIKAALVADEASWAFDSTDGRYFIYYKQGAVNVFRAELLLVP